MSLEKTHILATNFKLRMTAMELSVTWFGDFERGRDKNKDRITLVALLGCGALSKQMHRKE
ncbi:MAG: hypothetical protein ACFFCW_44445 [Candidatus Hodarchaeota archaeon]